MCCAWASKCGLYDREYSYAGSRFVPHRMHLVCATSGLADYTCSALHEIEVICTSVHSAADLEKLVITVITDCETCWLNIYAVL